MEAASMLTFSKYTLSITLGNCFFCMSVGVTFVITCLSAKVNSSVSWVVTGSGIESAKFSNLSGFFTGSGTESAWKINENKSEPSQNTERRKNTGYGNLGFVLESNQLKTIIRKMKIT
jgi:hypothetical protein